MIPQDDTLMTETEVADYLKINVKTLKDNRCRHPERVPPWIRLPGSCKVRFRLRDVRAFLDQGFSEGEKERARLEEMRKNGLYPFPKSGQKNMDSPSPAPMVPEAAPDRKRGRPTKREMLERYRG